MHATVFSQVYCELDIEDAYELVYHKSVREMYLSVLHILTLSTSADSV